MQCKKERDGARTSQGHWCSVEPESVLIEDTIRVMKESEQDHIRAIAEPRPLKCLECHKSMS